MRKTSIQWKWVIVSTIVFIVFLSFVLPQVSEYSTKVIGEFQSPDTSLIYSSEDLYDMAESYGEAGRAAYIKLRWTFDLIWPLVYTLFFVLWIVKLSYYVLSSRRIRYLFIVPLIAMFFDFTENLGATIIMARYPVTPGIIANLTPVMTFAKWITISMSFLIVLALLIANIMAKMKERRSANAF